ncbi:MAG: hypothetical protein ACXWV2_03270 [Chitinophagaceae bacterium]
MSQQREYIVGSRLFIYFSRFMAVQRRRTTNRPVNTTIIKLILFLLFVSGDMVSAQSLVVDKKKFFSDEQIIEMDLLADFKYLIRDKLKKDYETNFQPATITCLFPDSIKITEKIEIRARGQYRREECYIPSIMVNFKTPTAVTLKKLGRLKLVWSCGISDYEEQLVLKEYLVYKIYNLLTEKSFRVRLIKISYHDINEKIRPRKQFAFFIEDVDDMARRNNCVEVQPARPHTEATNRQQTTMVALFQYMIGNTDWAVPLYRNIKLIRSKEDSLSLPFTVPYDFDYCGLVNAKYAIPTPDLPITSVRERLYRGFRRTMEELQATLQIFRLQRLAIDSLITNFVPLETYHKKEMTKYIHEFFLATEKERNINDLFIKQARRK